MLQQRFSILPSPEDFGPPKNTPLFAALGLGALEAVWPTRCAVCDAPGALLCTTCLQELYPYDPWLACPACGAPFSLHQCCECNSYTQAKTPGRKQPLHVTSAVLFNRASGRMVKRFKDADEQRLAPFMARSMLHALSPETAKRIGAITYIPCSQKAFIRRGYDHGRLLGSSLARLLNVPLVDAFQRPHNLDQRTLSREERYANMESALNLKGSLELPPGPLLLIDDVLTTGATLNAAADILFAAGIRNVTGLTFARVV